MKSLIAILLILSSFSYGQSRELTINLKVLPELKDFFARDSVHISITSNHTRIDTFVLSSTKIVLKRLYPEYHRIEISSDIKCSDSISTKSYYWTVGINLSKVLKIQKNVTFPFNCEYNKHTYGKVCPKCKQSKFVIPILYGLLDPTSVRGEPGIDFELGGCMMPSCAPDWHCTLDNLDF